MTTDAAPGPSSSAPTGASAPTGPAELELLGALSYAELTSFLRLSADAASAPSVTDTEGLAAVAVAHFENYRLLRARLVEVGADPQAAMTPFVAALDAFHARTTPSSWTESLVKAYVGDGIATDFYLELSAMVGGPAHDLVRRVLHHDAPRAPAGAPLDVPVGDPVGDPVGVPVDTAGRGGPGGDDPSRADVVVAAVERATRLDPQLSGRLALWARRLVGEALSQAQGVAVQHPALAALLTGSDETSSGTDLVRLGQMFNRVTEAHVRRMKRLGLTA